MTWVQAWSAALRADDTARQFWGHPCFPFRRLFRDCTIRQQIRLGVATRRIVLRFSNEYSEEVLPITSVTIAKPVATDAYPNGVGSPDVSAESLTSVTFAGRREATIPPGAIWESDPIDLEVDMFADVTVSIYLKEGQAGITSSAHEMAKATSWLAEGDHAASPSINGKAFTKWYILSGVLAQSEKKIVACLGDSITDKGDLEWDTNTYLGWPNVLSRRLPSMGVINAGVSGDQLWRGGMSRLERDVFLPGVTHLVMLMGTNDLAWVPNHRADQDELYERLVAAFEQIYHLVQARGIKFMAATILPKLELLPGTNDVRPGDEERERTRLRVNEWLRQAPFEVVDWAAAMEGEIPGVMATKYRYNDFTHPNKAANQLMAELIDLDFFSSTQKANGFH